MEASLLTSPGTPVGARAGGFEARWLGRVDYAVAHDLQKRLVAERADGRIPDQVQLLEHPAVLT
ncbi:MAG: lipoate-protein ligase B, partial [Candidatus Limnocylindrales bacterium]